MLQFGIWLIWLALYQYYIEQICELEKGYIKRVVVWGLTLCPLLAAGIFSVMGLASAGTAGGRLESGSRLTRGNWLTFGSLVARENRLAFGSWLTCGNWLAFGSWLMIMLILFLYMLFYDAKPFRQQWWKPLVPGAVLALCALGRTPESAVFLNGGVMVVFLLMLAAERGYLRAGSSLVNLGIYGLLGAYIWQNAAVADTGEFVGILALELLLFLALEGTLFSWHRGFTAETERFQRDILSHQYEEVKEIYLNMRGWRHDYHNHLQAMKAQIAAGQLEEMKQYLSGLEQNLEKVDTYVKSGNIMADAILNSKLSLAEQKGIQVNCKAVLPEALSIEDVDLCVLLGNLLDNALEACEKIPEQQRFLRIYMVVNKSQLYVSVQNSAKEELDFNERNYISTKRGNHGLGMKRVKALADKYEGYLTLANEPGIFAAEVTLPL